MNEIDELEDILDAILKGVQEALQNGETLSPEFQNQIAQEITYLTNTIDELYTQNNPINPENPPIEPEAPLPETPSISRQPPVEDFEHLGNPPTADEQLLWLLAGEQEDAFVEYLKSYPTQNTHLLLNNPAELERVVKYLHLMMPSYKQPVVDDIQHGYLNSSVIWGTAYNPKTKQMKVRFQGGSEYEYDNVPINMYRAFTNGNATAKTTGSNKYGAWWKGKNPSLGAYMAQYIRNADFPYRKIK